jgi:hypothetical protein
MALLAFKRLNPAAGKSAGSHSTSRVRESPPQSYGALAIDNPEWLEQTGEKMVTRGEEEAR